MLVVMINLERRLEAWSGGLRDHHWENVDGFRSVEEVLGSCHLLFPGSVPEEPRIVSAIGSLEGDLSALRTKLANARALVLNRRVRDEDHWANLLDGLEDLDCYIHRHDQRFRKSCPILQVLGNELRYQTYEHEAGHRGWEQIVETLSLNEEPTIETTFHKVAGIIVSSPGTAFREEDISVGIDQLQTQLTTRMFGRSSPSKSFATRFRYATTMFA